MKMLLNSRLFLAGLLVRVLFLPFEGSYYLEELFVPFLNYGALHITENPWTQFSGEYFPYGLFQYLVLVLPRWAIFSLLPAETIAAYPWLSTALVKAPLILFDVLILRCLIYFVPERRRQLYLLYWLNPCLVYISYVHGQLDVISMSMVFCSLVAASKGRINLSAVFFSMAALAKFHVVAALPLVMIWIWLNRFPRQALRDMAGWISIFICVVSLGSIPPLLADKLLYNSVGSPDAMRLFATHFDLGLGVELYVGVMAVLAVLGRLCISERMSTQGLFYGCGIVYCTLLLFARTGAGWYFWCMPFFAAFFAAHVTALQAVYWFATISYLVYFIPIDFFFSQWPQPLGGLIYATLHTTLAGIMFFVWDLMLRAEAPLNYRTKPLIIGIAGDSGTGKDFTARWLVGLLGRGRSAIVEGDNYHKWERGHEKWADYTHLSPKANHLGVLSEHTSQLKRSQPVYYRRYDHATGRFTTNREVSPKRNLIVQGLHTFYPRGLRDEIDLKIFLAPAKDVRVSWKVARDVGERGHHLNKVMESIREREQDSNLHIDPQRQFADWIISMTSTENLSDEDIAAGKRPELISVFEFWNDLPLENLVESLNQIDGVEANLEPNIQDLNRVRVTVSGELTRQQVKRLADELFPDLRAITKTWKEPEWSEGQTGLAQLFAVNLLRQTGNKTV